MAPSFMFHPWINLPETTMILLNNSSSGLRVGPTSIHLVSEGQFDFRNLSTNIETQRKYFVQLNDPNAPKPKKRKGKKNRTITTIYIVSFAILYREADTRVDLAILAIATANATSFSAAVHKRDCGG